MNQGHVIFPSYLWGNRAWESSWQAVVYTELGVEWNEYLQQMIKETWYAVLPDNVLQLIFHIWMSCTSPKHFNPSLDPAIRPWGCFDSCLWIHYYHYTNIDDLFNWEKNFVWTISSQFNLLTNILSKIIK